MIGRQMQLKRLARPGQTPGNFARRDGAVVDGCDDHIERRIGSAALQNGAGESRNQDKTYAKAFQLVLGQLRYGNFSDGKQGNVQTF